MYDGYVVSFDEIIVWFMGWMVFGVCGICLCDDDFVIGFDVLKFDSNVFIIMEKGYGK